MTTSEDPRDIAVDTLAAVKAVIDHLDGVHDQLHHERDLGGYVAVETKLSRQIGKCNDSIRYGIKFAEINALVAIADRLADFGDLVELTRVPVASEDQTARLSELTGCPHVHCKMQVGGSL